MDNLGQVSRNRQARTRASIRRKADIAARRRGVKEPDIPSRVVDNPAPQRVDRGHIVPAFYQRSWGQEQMIAVHDLEGRCSQLSIKREAGVRGPYYRRTRPTGDETDDIEASLASLENVAARSLREIVNDGADLTTDRKARLASFLAAQMLRGPAHFAQREERLRSFVGDIDESGFTRDALREAGGEIERARTRLLGVLLDPTYKFLEMLKGTNRLATCLVNMRWHLLEFDELSLATSDHPVVVWPLELTNSKPFDEPFAGPLGALEIRVAVSPSLAILLNWADGPDLDCRGTLCSARAARELNAFVTAQAQQEWMHHPAAEPSLHAGASPPLSRIVDRDYNASVAVRSRHHAFVAKWQQQNRGRQWINELTVLER